jgi:Omp85 superfamily domain
VGAVQSGNKRLLAAALRSSGLAVWLVASLSTPAAAAESTAAGDQAAADNPLAPNNPTTPGGAAQPAPAAKPPSKIKSSEDGWLDISGFLDKSYGFVPIVIPITEPAVGYGAAGGLLFIDRPQGGAPGTLSRPNMTVVGGLATDNGTRGVMVGDVRHWHDERVQTVIGGVDASVNLDFYGFGKDSQLNKHPLSYNLEPLGGAVRGRYRFGASHLWAGLSYALADTQIDVEEAPSSAALLDAPARSRVGGLTPSLAYDTRDNIFTPTRGMYAEGTSGFFDPNFGGDGTFQRVSLIDILYLPVHSKVTLGVKTQATFTFGDTPFYMLPFISLRGAPVMRYQGQEAADIETEARWQCWRRISVVGFLGYGAAWNDFQHLDNTISIVTGGTGFRYELARKYGLHAGLDVAWGPDDTALYIQFGSAWARP